MYIQFHGSGVEAISRNNKERVVDEEVCRTRFAPELEVPRKPDNKMTKTRTLRNISWELEHPVTQFLT